MAAKTIVVRTLSSNQVVKTLLVTTDLIERRDKIWSKFLCAVPWTSRPSLDVSKSPWTSRPSLDVSRVPRSSPSLEWFFRNCPSCKCKGRVAFHHQNGAMHVGHCETFETFETLWEVWDTVRAVTLWDTARRLRHCRTLWDLWDGRGRKESLAA